MARIQAGSTLVNQYTPPFVVSDYVAQGWELVWNDTLQAFEAVDPLANVTEGGFSSIESALFPNVTQQVFVVSWVAASKQSLVITIQGVKQQQDAYTYMADSASGTTTVTLSDTVLNETVEILGLQADGGASVEVYQETAIAAQTLFPAAGSIGWYPPSEQSLIVTLDGVKQNSSEYSVVPNATYTGAQVQLTAAPGDGVVVEILGITTTGETIASPVLMANALTDAAPTTLGLYKAKSVTGETQVFTLKNLSAGANITLADGAGSNSVEITATQPLLAETATGGGTSLFDTLDQDAPVFRKLLAADGSNMALSVAGADNPIAIAYNHGYLADAGPTITLTDPGNVNVRLVHVTHSGPVTVNLAAASSFAQGDKITIKDGNGTGGTNTITISPNGTDEINGVNADIDLTTANAYITLYSDGTHWHIIGQG